MSNNKQIQHAGGAVAQSMPQRPNPVAVPQTDVAKWNAEEMEVLTNLIAKDCSPVEMALFSNVCHKTGLDPFSRQIYAIKRSGKMTIQTSIDGFRAIAEDTGEYAGNDEPLFNGTLTLAQHIADTGNAKTPPVTATVTVYRIVKGNRCAFSASAAFDQYSQPKSPVWSAMPHTMIAKCAEALALRKAFPRKLSGLYTGDEMEQSDEPTPVEQMTAPPASKEQTTLVSNLMASHVITETERAKIMGRMDRGMTKKEASGAIKWLQTEIKARKAQEAELSEDEGLGHITAEDLDDGYEATKALTPEEVEQLDESLQAAGI